MGKYSTVVVDGYWLDNKEKFCGMVVARGSWDGVEDAEDQGIFYYLDGAAPVGEHEGFFITNIAGV